MSESSSPKPKRLLDEPRETIRIKHYAYSTEKTYVHWAKRYILFHNKHHPAEMGAPEIEAFLSSLAQEGNVSAPTPNQAFNALLFLYRNVLHIELHAPIHALRAKDIDFEQSQIVVREGKGEKDRLTMLPASLVAPVKAQITLPHWSEKDYSSRAYTQ